MTDKLAKQIGAKYALKSILIALLIFYLIPSFLFFLGDFNFKHFLWFLELDFYNWIFILNWILFFFLFTFIFGRRAGLEILISKKIL